MSDPVLCVRVPSAITSVIRIAVTQLTAAVLQQTSSSDSVTIVRRAPYWNRYPVFLCQRWSQRVIVPVVLNDRRRRTRSLRRRRTLLLGLLVYIEYISSPCASDLFVSQCNCHEMYVIWEACVDTRQYIHFVLHALQHPFGSDSSLPVLR